MRLPKIFTLLLLLAATVAGAQPHDARHEILSNFNRSGSNHYAYPYPANPLPALTAAPDGYEPFYIDHYGRHGSRWLTRESYYTEPVQQLEIAERNRQLTARGEQLLKELRLVQNAAAGRAGELSDVGAEQHRGIARRMVQNFPEIFSDGAVVDARSTVVIRCILSMAAATGQIRAMAPGITVTTDASEHDMHYMGWGKGEDTLANHLRDEVRPLSDSIFAARVNPRRFVAQLVRDSAFAADSLKCLRLMERTFDIAGSLQNHHVFDGMNIFDVFTGDEIYTLWQCKNIYWYLQWANCPQSGNRMPFIERALLRDFVEKADDAIARDRHGAALRYGHETCLLPLACLMELDNVNYSCDNLDELHKHWQNYNIFPMGCNIQVVFYRPQDKRLRADDVLVKILLNEHEATLPITPDTAAGAPYYRWSDVRDHFLKKINTPTHWATPARW